MENQLNLREKQSVSGMITLVFRFIKEHIVNLLKSFSLLALPWILVSSLFIGFFYSKLGDYVNLGPEVGFAQLKSMLTLIPGSIFGFIGFVAFSATITSYIKLTISHHKSEITTRMVAALVKKYFGKLFVGILLISIVLTLVFAVIMSTFIAIGSTALTVIVAFISYLGLIYILMTLCHYAFPIIIEDKSKMDSIKRCFFLIKKYWWRSFGLFFLLSMIQSMLSYVIMIPMYILGVMESLSAGAAGLENDPTLMFKLMGTLMPIIMIAYSFFYIITAVGIGVNYFCLVEIKEEVGLKAKIAALSEEPELNEA